MMYKLRYVLLAIVLLLNAPLAYMIGDCWLAFWTNVDIETLGYSGNRGAFAVMSAAISVGVAPLLFITWSNLK